MKPDQQHKILLADDHEMMLDGLKAIIEAEPDLYVVGTARNGEELISKAAITKPDLCIVDLDMPVMNGLEAAPVLLRRQPETKIILLTMHKEKSILRKVKEAGIHGYLLKTGDSEELLFALRQVLKGKTYYTVQLMNFSEDEENKTHLEKIAQLTNREREIIKHLCEGYSNGKIAEKLFISISTVDNHRTNIMRKLDVHNIVELTRFCLTHKLA